MDATTATATPIARGPRTVRPREPDDAVGTYLRSMVHLPRLEPAVQDQLLRAYHSSRDPALARRLVLANLRLVVKIAGEYRRSGADLRDLVQEGVLGLMRAVEKFDPAQQVKLSTYAALWIRAHLLRYLTRNWRQVKIGTTQAQRRIFFNLPGELRRLAQEDTDESPAAVIAARLRVRPDEVESLMQRLAARELSLDAPLDREGHGTARVDQLADDEAGRPDAQAESAMMHQHLRDCVASIRGELGPRETVVLDERMLADEALSLDALARRLGMTREGVRQIERRVVRRLADRLDSSGQTASPRRAAHRPPQRVLSAA
jgi:RNA polymerase sigma-32 factor